jgi:hypothetical protein
LGEKVVAVLADVAPFSMEGFNLPMQNFHSLTVKTAVNVRVNLYEFAHQVTE